MPVSTPVHVSHCIQRIQAIEPKSVLDVGCGFGLWGFLCREYLDIWNRRLSPDQWQVRIDGIELFEPYIQPHQRSLYSNIIIGDVREAVEQVGEYDLIIAGDVIEHLDKLDGEAVLERLYEKAQKALIVNIPLGDGWEHPEEHGNPGELHRSQWHLEDFVQYPCELKRFELPCGGYGVFTCPKPAPMDARVRGLTSAGNLRAGRGDFPGALRSLWQAYDLDPANPDVLRALASVLIDQGESRRAVEVVENVAAADPSPAIALLLARTLIATGERARAREQLQALANTPGLPPALLGSVQTLLAQL